MNNWKTSLTGIATAIFGALAALAAAPYNLGPIADFIPPDLKAEIFKWCGLAAFVSFILKSVFTADKPPAAVPLDAGGRPSVIEPKNIVLLIAGVGFIALGGCVLSGCAVESPKFSIQIPHSGLSAYGYAGAGLTIDPDADTLAAAAK